MLLRTPIDPLSPQAPDGTISQVYSFVSGVGLSKGWLNTASRVSGRISSSHSLPRWAGRSTLPEPFFPILDDLLYPRVVLFFVVPRR